MEEWGMRLWALPGLHPVDPLPSLPLWQSNPLACFASENVQICFNCREKCINCVFTTRSEPRRQCTVGLPHCPWFTKNRNNPWNFSEEKFNRGPNRPQNKDKAYFRGWGTPKPHKKDTQERQSTGTLPKILENKRLHNARLNSQSKLRSAIALFYSCKLFWKFVWIVESYFTAIVLWHGHTFKVCW